MRKTTLSLLTAAALALPLAGNAAATFGGKPLEPTDPMLRSVIKLEATFGSYKSFCTGVIVGPDTIATAAHCLFRVEDAEEPMGAENFVIRYYYDATLGRVASMRYNKINDLALLKTAQKHPAGFVVPEQDLRPIDDIVRDTQGATFIHFGHGPRSRKSPSTLTRLEDTALTLQVRNGTVLRMLHSGYPEPLGTCGGDSGGPVMIEDERGSLKLIGIHQAGQKRNINYAIPDSDGNCSRVSYFSPMSRMKNWLDELAQEERIKWRPREVSPETIKMGKMTKTKVPVDAAPAPVPLEAPDA